MNNKEINLRVMLMISGFILLSGSIQQAVAQEYRWLRVGQSETYVVDYGA